MADSIKQRNPISDQDSNKDTRSQPSFDPDLKVAPHFPLVLSYCRDPASKFFRCLVNTGFADVSLDHNPSRAKIALTRCQEEMKSYDECMYFHLPQFQDWMDHREQATMQRLREDLAEIREDDDD